MHHHQRHHQQQLQEQHSKQFVTDNRNWLGSEKDQELQFPKDVQRRSKRNVPEMEKDERYWEKRRRNNLAAQRSRENKRLLEKDIKDKVSCLEEQNAVLRKEIVLINSRVGIPIEQCILTPEERAQCVLEVKQTQEYNRTRHRKDSGSEDVTSTTQTNDLDCTLQTLNKRLGNRDECSRNVNGSSNILEGGPISGTNSGTPNYGRFTSSPNCGLATVNSMPSFSRNEGNECCYLKGPSKFMSCYLLCQEQKNKVHDLVNRSTNLTHTHFSGHNRQQFNMDGNEEKMLSFDGRSIAREQRYGSVWLGRGVLDLLHDSKMPPSASCIADCPEDETTVYDLRCAGQNCWQLGLSTLAATIQSNAQNLPATSINYINKQT